MEKNQPKAEEELEGEKYLRILGLGHLANEAITVGNKTIQAKDFLEICGEQARPVFVGLETITSKDPRYEPTVTALRELVLRYIDPSVA